MLDEILKIDTEQLSAIVPDCYAEFRPLVADGIQFFVENLSERRLNSVLQAQARLSPAAPFPQRLVQFLHECPALHKLGQVVARNRHLDGALRQQLQGLESLEPSTAMNDVRPALERELMPSIKEYR